MKKRKILSTALAFSMTVCACGTSASANIITANSTTENVSEASQDVTTTLSKIDQTKWQYNSEDNVYCK